MDFQSSKVTLALFLLLQSRNGISTLLEVVLESKH